MTSFQRTGRRERFFVGPGPQGKGTAVPIGGRDAAFALLRDLGREPSGQAALRRLYAETVGRAAVCWETDHAVLEGLARRLMTRELKAWYVPLPDIEAPVGALLPVPEAEPKPADEKPTPLLENPRWSVPRVEVGAEIDAIFTYAGFTGPKEATVTIFELNLGAGKDEIAKLKTTVPAGKGDHKVKWKRTPDEAKADLEEDVAAGDSGPLEYHFKVETQDLECPGESGPLWLTNTVTVELVKDDGGKQAKSRGVVLKDALGKEFRATSKDGEAKFEKVLVGPTEIRLAEPLFTDLAWSAPKVPVGEPVDAVFKYEDAIQGMKVEVVVHEWNADGSSTEIDRVEVELGATSGEAKAPFTRTEDEAQADMAADEREGDTGPVEYRYFVAADDAAPSEESSGPLWLTHTVELGIERADGGASFPDGTELLIIGADGTEHRSKIDDGKAKFEGVVCGPMLVKLAPKEEAP